MHAGFYETVLVKNGVRQQGYMNWVCTGSLVEKSGDLYVTSASGGAFGGILINMTPYSKLKVTAKYTTVTTGTKDYIKIGISKSVVSGLYLTTYYSPTSDYMEYIFDISGFEGDYYFVIAGYTQYNSVISSLILS